MILPGSATGTPGRRDLLRHARERRRAAEFVQRLQFAHVVGAGARTLQGHARAFVLLDRYFDNGPLSRYAALRRVDGHLADTSILLTDESWYDTLQGFGLADYGARLEACLGKQEWPFYLRAERDQPGYSTEWNGRVTRLVELIASRRYPDPEESPAASTERSG